MNIKMLKYFIYSDLQIGVVGWGLLWEVVCLSVLDCNRKKKLFLYKTLYSPNVRRYEQKNMKCHKKTKSV